MAVANINIKFAKESECSLLLDFIRELALYEKRIDKVTATRENIYDIIFKRNLGKAIIAEINRIPAGFALFF